MARSDCSMQRARPFRLTAMRLGFTILAWYALVLQGVLLASVVKVRPGLDPAQMASLCLEGGGTSHEGPGQPGHAGCECILHCAGAGPLGSPEQFGTAGLRLTSGQMIAAAANDFSIPAFPRAGAPARGPPAMAFSAV